MKKLIAPVLLATILAPCAALAQVTVIISGGFSGPYERLVPLFEKPTGAQVTTGSGASQGSGPQTIAAQLERGVDADGVAVRAGAPKPSVQTVDDFKALMLRAKAVAVPSSTSGIFLANDVLPRLGIAGKVALKPMPRGAQAAALVVSGEAELAVMPVSEIVHAPGLELAGVLAEEIQLHQVFSAAVTVSARHRDAARKLIAYLGSSEAAPEIRKSGMEPIGVRR